jgi:hypothetical protein
MQVMNFGNSHPFAPRDAEAGTRRNKAPRENHGFCVALMGLLSYRAGAIKWGRKSGFV